MGIVGPATLEPVFVNAVNAVNAKPQVGVPKLNVYLWQIDFLSELKLLDGRRDSYVVYFIQSGDNPSAPIKIGVAKNLALRLDILQVSHYEKLSIRLVCSCASQYDSTPVRRLERHFHKVFSEYRIRGEWFRAEGKLSKFIDDPLNCLEFFGGCSELGPDPMSRLLRQGIDFD